MFLLCRAAHEKVPPPHRIRPPHTTYSSLLHQQIFIELVYHSNTISRSSSNMGAKKLILGTLLLFVTIWIVSGQEEESCDPVMVPNIPKRNGDNGYRIRVDRLPTDYVPGQEYRGKFHPVSAKVHAASRPGLAGMRSAHIFRFGMSLWLSASFVHGRSFIFIFDKRGIHHIDHYPKHLTCLWMNRIEVGFDFDWGGRVRFCMCVRGCAYVCVWEGE